MKLGLIGFGGMARAAVSVLREHSGAFEFSAALAPPDEIALIKNPPVPLVDNLAALLRSKPDLVIECAAHEAVRQYGEKVLRAGVPLIVMSIGALADEALFARLRTAATDANASLSLPAGAVGGIDALVAARLSGLRSVCYRARKPARAWAGTPAEEALDLAALRQAECFFTGNARDAALLYPKNSNVAATVAIAGLGFDATRVELIADPDITENRHEIEVDANSGAFHIRLSGAPLPDSPKTSALAAYSVVKCALERRQSLIIG